MEGTSRYSAPIILIIEFFVALLLALYLLYKYGDLKRQNPFVTGCTLLVWFMSFFIIFLLPVDVSSAFYQLCLEQTRTLSHQFSGSGSGNFGTYDCNGFVCKTSLPQRLQHILEESPNACASCFQPYTFVCLLPLKILWYIIYWLFFVLSWLILPLGQSYVAASYFSVCKKILRMIIENVLIYATFLVIFIILFIYLVVVKKIAAPENIPFLLATASNTWGLLILTLLLGYGLVEVPRSLWNASRRKYTLNHCYFKAAKLYTDMADANEKMKEVEERVGQVAQSIHYNDPLRKYIDIIIKKFPKDKQKDFSRGHDDFEDFQTSQDPLTKGGLESLLKKTMKTTRFFSSTRIQWLALTDKTLDLEDIQTNSTSHVRRFQSSLRLTNDKKWYGPTLEKIEWYWKLWVLPWTFRIGAVFFGLLSLVIVWCEVTFGIYVSPTIRLSIFAEIVNVLHNYGNYFAVEVLSIVVVAYMSICAYFTVFRIRIFNLYNVAPHHSTDEYSLLFSAVLLSRLALPICLNYLYMIQVVELEQHENSTTTPQTAFAIATGNTDLIPWLTNYFYIYYPMLIIVVCLATLFSVGTRLVSLFGYQKFIGEDDFSADYIDEGKILMKRERRVRERNLKEYGKGKNRDQLPFELLRESAAASSGRGVDRFSHRRTERGGSLPRNQAPLHEEDESRISRFFSSVKNYAVQGKNAISSKYQSAKVAYSSRKNEDDVVELLPTSRSGTSPPSSGSESKANGSRFSQSSTGTSWKDSTGFRGGASASREPPKGIFDDI